MSAGLPEDLAAYHAWIRHHEEACRREPDGPGSRQRHLISLVLPVGDASAEAALASCESVCTQDYANWELILSGRFFSPWPRTSLEGLAATDSRIRMSEAKTGVSAIRGGLTVCAGTLVAVLEPGDLLAPEALDAMEGAFGDNPDWQLAYSDEDQMVAGERVAPWFKPAYSPELLLAGNYFGQLTLYRRECFERLTQAGDTASGIDLYATALRAAAVLTPQGIGHLPRILCHRRAVVDWPAYAPAANAGIVGLAGLEAVDGTNWPRPRFRLPEPRPLVSAIICTRDRHDLLRTCIAGLLTDTNYSPIEVLIVDNDSREDDTLTLLAELGRDSRVRVLQWSGNFNFAAMNNFAARHASGEVLLLLNNDIEVQRPDWLGELVSHAMRPDVGAVGACLLYPDGSVQHAGIILGPAGAATHVGRHAAANDPGYFGQLATLREVSAVTGACLATRREVFSEVGGLEERLAVTWNDVDYCLRVRRSGRRIIFTPFARLTHHEAATRGHEAESPEKQRRFLQEQALMRDIWGDAVDCDPFLNENLQAHENGKLVFRAHFVAHD